MRVIFSATCARALLLLENVSMKFKFTALDLPVVGDEVNLHTYLNETDMTLCGCPHLSALKASNGTQYYSIIHSFFISCTSTESRKRKVQK